MSFKHQTEIYRTCKGIRFICDGDIIDASKGDLHWQATEMVRGFKDQGRDAFFEKIDNSFYRVFAEFEAQKGTGQ